MDYKAMTTEELLDEIRKRDLLDKNKLKKLEEME